MTRREYKSLTLHLHRMKRNAKYKDAFFFCRRIIMKWYFYFCRFDINIFPLYRLIWCFIRSRIKKYINILPRQEGCKYTFLPRFLFIFLIAYLTKTSNQIKQSFVFLHHFLLKCCLIKILFLFCYFKFFLFYCSPKTIPAWTADPVVCK